MRLNLCFHFTLHCLLELFWITSCVQCMLSHTSTIVTFPWGCLKFLYLLALSTSSYLLYQLRQYIQRLLHFFALILICDNSSSSNLTHPDTKSMTLFSLFSGSDFDGSSLHTFRKQSLSRVGHQGKRLASLLCTVQTFDKVKEQVFAPVVSGT